MAENGDTQRLLTQDSFEKVLESATSAFEFRCYLRGNGKNEELLLDFWLVWKFATAARRSSAFEKFNLSSGGPFYPFIPDDLKKEEPNEPLYASLSQHFHKLLYDQRYPDFLQQMLALSHQDDISERAATKSILDGVFAAGDSLSLAYMYKHDLPLVYCSDGFLAVSGYTREDCLNKNCRFLQGPGTDGAALDRIRAKIKDGEECLELLLNYRKNESPFFNLLLLTPLRDLRDQVQYYFGAQIDVTENMQASNPLKSYAGGPYVSRTTDDLPSSKRSFSLSKKKKSFEFGWSFLSFHP
eukprot:Lithocolla_globosa_v1_NODE_6478_length_1081_cov_9.586745.p1 type:complete len:298 gc:universal NODE_6478_length_1081_cov_9.586745:171-1064(+)